jgi:hypothetical protein
MSVAVLAAMFVASQLSGAVITSGEVTLDAGDSTQTGRVFRNAIPSEWGATKAFPGITSNTSTFNWESVAFNTGAFNQIQISYSFARGDGNTNIFGVAYGASYNPADLAAGYLGDPGSSVTQSFPGPQVFRLDTALNADILLVFSTSSTTGFGTVGYTVEGFSSAVPEPATFGCLGLGLALFALKLRRRS